MKRNISVFFLLIVISVCFGQEVYYELKNDSVLLNQDGLMFKETVMQDDDIIRELEKGAIVKYNIGDDFSLFGFIDDEYFSSINVMTQNGVEGKAIFEHLKLLTDNQIPNAVLNTKWISAYTYKYLNTNLIGEMNGIQELVKNGMRL